MVMKNKRTCSSSLSPWKAVVVAVVLLVVHFPTSAVQAKDEESNSAKSRLITKPEWTRKRNKSSECRLAGTRFPINATWSPDLGPPFGVWNCVKCTCTPVQKKKRIVAKVMCKNIKQQCPDVKCEEAVLEPGACCKICPGDAPFREGYIMEEPQVENLSERDFAVLLNGRTTRSPLTTRSIATGRIFLRRGTLHFSFVLGATTPAPTTIQFQTEDGNILEEVEVHPTPYEVNNCRVCGTWTRVPRQYRTLLLTEKLWVALVPSDEESIISGRIARYMGVDTEVFSSLLTPSTSANQTLLGGGTAIISVSAPSDSLHVSLIFNGIFKSNDARNVTIVVELSPSRKLDPVQDTVVLSKVYSDINEAGVKTTLGDESLRLLARGKVLIRVWSHDSPELALEGTITARATCNVFHSVLTSSSSERNLVSLPSKMSYGAGWGLLYLVNDGDFEYQMKLEGLPRPVDKILLQMISRKKVKDIEDITSTYRDGWVNGTYSKPTYRDLDTLLRSHLQVAVLMKDGMALRGIFEPVSVTEALRAFHPSLLMSPLFWMASTTWVAVDEDCVMHYDVHVAGDDPSGAFDPTWSLQLRENDTSWDPRLDLVNVTLEHIVTGREVASHTTFLSKVSLSRLHAGVMYLDLSILGSEKDPLPVALLTGVLKQVHVPPHCLLYHDNEGGFEATKTSDRDVQVDAPCRGFVCLDEEIKPVISKKCIDDDKRVYEDGTTWKSPVNNCAKCMCTLGRIKCQDEPCPKPSCQDAILLPGQCCSSCPVVSGIMSERVCKMDTDIHIIGAFWHPFLAPKGFDRCVTCYCNITPKSEPFVECSRVSCPQLICLDSEAKFKGDSCCPRCPDIILAARNPFPLTPSVVKGMISEGLLEISPEQKREMILADGGCLERKNIPRANGDIWYPRLSPNGVPQCVSCNCKDGRIKCSGCSETECKKGQRCRLKNEKRKKFHRKRKNRRRERKRLV